MSDHVRTLLAVGAVGGLILMSLAVGRSCRTANRLALASLGDRLEFASRQLDARLGAATREFHAFVDMGFARLSTASLTVGPDFGIVRARLHRTQAVAPLTAPFQRLVIVTASGRALWEATAPQHGAGDLRFARVQRAAAVVDTVGLAAAAATADGRLSLRRPDTLRLLYRFSTDPYNDEFYALADLPVHWLLEGVEDRAPATPWEVARGVPLKIDWRCVDLAEAAPELAESQWVERTTSGVREALPGASQFLTVQSVGVWPEDRWTATQVLTNLSVAIEGSMQMGGLYRQVVWDARFGLAALAWVTGVAIWLLERGGTRAC